MGRQGKEDMKSEIELLLCCARTSLDSEKTVRIKSLLKKNMDWQCLLDTAVRNGVMPLLYRTLKEVSSEEIPHSFMKDLEELYNANARRNLFLTGELLKLLHLFEEHKIPAIPYKGPAIASSVYGDLALRQFSDLDILIKRQDVLKAGDILVSFGYRPQSEIPMRNLGAYLKSQYELPFSRHDGKIIVELQWEIVPRYFNFPIASLQLWDCVVKNGSGLPSIPFEDTLLILCVHGTKHLWSILAWVCDIAELIRKELDWELVMYQAKKLGIQRILFLGLFLANDLLTAPLPDRALNHIEKDPLVRVLADKIKIRFFRSAHSPGIFQSCLFHLQAKEHITDRIRYCVRLAMGTTPGDWALVALPPFLSFLYHFIRPVRLATRYGLKLLKHSKIS